MSVKGQNNYIHAHIHKSCGGEIIIFFSVTEFSVGNQSITMHRCRRTGTFLNVGSDNSVD